MTLVTLRPNGTNATAAAGVTITGAADAQTALSDNSDASYVQLVDAAGQRNPYVTLDLGDLTLPAGAVLRSITARSRNSTLSGSNLLTLHTLSGGIEYGELSGGVTVHWTTATTVQHGNAYSTGLTKTIIDGLLMRLRCDSSDITLRVYESYLDVRYVVPPVVVVNAPTGTVTTTTQPLVSWTDTLDSDGGGQTFYEIKVFSAVQYGAGGFDPATSPPTYTSGLLYSNNGSQNTGPIADGTYRAYVRVAQTVNGAAHWSAWAFTAFTVSVLLPGVPSMTLTPDMVLGRTTIVLNSGSGAASTDALELQRSSDNGVTWAAVRNVGGLGALIPQVGGGAVTVSDYEAPNGIATLYRARALHNYSGLYAVSAWNVITESFEAGFVGWVQLRFATVYGDQAGQHPTSGVRVLRCIGTVTNDDSNAYSPAFTVVAGQAISAQCDIYVNTAATGSTTGLIRIEFDDGGGTFGLTPADGGLIAAGTGARQATALNKVAPATAVKARLRILGNTSGTTTIDWELDTILIAIGFATIPFVTWSSSQWWLKHPNHPGVNVPVELKEYGPVSRAARQGVMQPLGAARPIVTDDSRGGAKGTTVLLVLTTTALAALERLLLTPGTLLLQGPLAAGIPDRYIRVGDISSQRITENINLPATLVTLPWAEVARPGGPIL